MSFTVFDWIRESLKETPKTTRELEKEIQLQFNAGGPTVREALEALREDGAVHYYRGQWKLGKPTECTCCDWDGDTDPDIPLHLLTGGA